MEDASAVCARCRRPFAEGEVPDPNGWCAACRRHVVRASTRAAVIPALLVAGGFGWLLYAFALLESRWMIGFVALWAGVAWLAFKVARRVAFDVYRARARRRSAQA